MEMKQEEIRAAAIRSGITVEEADDCVKHPRLSAEKTDDGFRVETHADEKGVLDLLDHIVGGLVENGVDSELIAIAVALGCAKGMKSRG